MRTLSLFPSLPHLYTVPQSGRMRAIGMGCHLGGRPRAARSSVENLSPFFFFPLCRYCVIVLWDRVLSVAQAHLILMVILPRRLFQNS